MGLFSKNTVDSVSTDADYIEVDEQGNNSKGHFLIRIENLSDFNDTTVIQQYIRNGDIIWVKIKSLREKDMSELKRAIDRLRKTCVAINGDIAGVDEDFIVLTPPGVKLHRME
ncbi:MAG: cell division protein SepF [DPANN group archaeon]|nr:cell division protein SepF [DPANN group archaeon]